MNWLYDLFQHQGVAQTVLLFCLAIFPGIKLGEFGIQNIKLGLAAVLFTGLAVGAMGFSVNQEMLHFTKEFGLILFVFTIGLQVGPGFLRSLKNQGLKLNLLAASLVIIGLGIALIEFKVLEIPLPQMVGLYSGAVTNTPGLGAAQQALAENYATLHPGTPNPTNLAGSGYAVAYPFGIMGIILSMLLIKWIFKIQTPKEEEKLKSRSSLDNNLCTFSCRVEHPAIAGLTSEKLSSFLKAPLIISRLKRNERIIIPELDTPFELQDILQIVCSCEEENRIKDLVGSLVQDDIRAQSEYLSVARFLVCKNPHSGKSLKECRFEERYKLRITRIVRSGVELLAHPDAELFVGDSLTVVGEKENTKLFKNAIGDKAALDHPNLIPLFLGMFLGVLLGSLPISLPGVPAPVKLGLAGGPLLVAIIMGHLRRVGPLNFYMPQGSNLMLREVGILLFLAAVGLGAGKSFIHALSSGEGWLWMACGAAITFIPVFTIGMAARFLKVNYLTIAGLLAGSMTDPPALGYANSLSKSPEQASAYASVYPLTMFLRVLGAQLFVILLC
jgi:putative transport protein